MFDSRRPNSLLVESWSYWLALRFPRKLPFWSKSLGGIGGIGIGCALIAMRTSVATVGIINPIRLVRTTSPIRIGGRVLILWIGAQVAQELFGENRDTPEQHDCGKYADDFHGGLLSSSLRLCQKLALILDQISGSWSPPNITSPIWSCVYNLPHQKGEIGSMGRKSFGRSRRISSPN